ncbi:sulfotransferase 1C4-like [Macrobrachium rosenbergii]|uniref:sulfotransferase 1C4-like n=1 Tax=Macrobrachium rosenbergii TaxID=79674 RepID=UPI0034D56867
MASPFPFELTRMERSEEEPLQKRFLAYTEGLVRVQPSGYVMPSQYSKFADKYYNFCFREDDVVIMTHPKCGTTWLQEIIWTMRNGVDINTDLALDVRSPFIEFDSLEGPHLKPFQPTVDAFNERNPGRDHRDVGLHLEVTMRAPSPRTIKTHLPFAYLNPNLLDTCKVVYCTRNPKDACVSYYHHQRLVRCTEFIGDFAEFVDYWCQDLLTQGPFWFHVSEGWAQRSHPNVLFLFYEDMKEDILRELRRLDDFLNTALTERQLQTVANHTKISNMKARGTSDPTEAATRIGRFVEGEEGFIRKGESGGWSSYFTPELEAKFQKWMDKWAHVAKEVPFRYKV